MALFDVNLDLCRLDGICVETCPLKLIEQKTPQSAPEPIVRAEAFCINCGHCVAVCPVGALSLKTMRPDDCPPIKPELTPTPEMVEHFLRRRRSVRVYKHEAVEREVLQQLIEIAGYAPSGHNLQPLNWIIIYDKTEVKRYSAMVIDWMKQALNEEEQSDNALLMKHIINKWNSGAEMILREAPHLIVTHAAKEELSAPKASAIALTYLELAASAVGLGTCWAGYFVKAVEAWPSLRHALDLSDEVVVLGAVMIGYPKYQYQRLPLRKEPRITWSL